MSLISLFDENVFTDLFQNKLKLDIKEKVKFFVEYCSRNERILTVKVAPENKYLNVDHVMVKMQSTPEVGKKKIEYAKSLENVFTIQDNNKDIYLGFAKKGILYPYKNNLENLINILKNLAEFQANNLVRSNSEASEATTGSEYNMKNLSNVLLSLDFFKDLDKSYINDVISRHQLSIDELFTNGLLVKSVGSIFANNVFITGSDKCVFLDLGHEVFRSPVYDALTFIFALSDGNFRQHHLKTLLTFYYQTFIEYVKKIDSGIATNFNVNVFEYHVRVISLIVKFETAEYLIQKEKTFQENKTLQELLNNILFSIKYEYISYEDCLEAVSKKLGSTHFQLISYQLVSLDQKNGHLGQYFNLKIVVNFSNKTKEFTLFTKILKTENSQMNNLVQSGVSEKEQFFFRTLIPLFQEHGLETLLDFAPNCYFDRLNDVIVLDNLAELGYKPFKTNARLEYDVLKSVFQKSAKFHACTLILEDRMSKSEKTTLRMGDIYKEFFEDWIFASREDLPRAPVNAVESKPGLDQLIDSCEDVPKDITKEEFHRRVDAIYGEFLKRINTPAKQFRNVICHGDLYASNILTKYDKNGLVEDSVTVDFQALRYAPIAGDLLMLVYFSANKDVRDKYLDRLLEEYYRELGQIMVQFGLDVNSFYTPEEFTECVKYMKPVAIMAAVFYAPLMALSSEQKENYLSDDSKFKYYLFGNRKEYIKCLLSDPGDCSGYLKGLIRDLYDFCVSSEYNFF